ncbi:MAG: MATE family efflux transporter [Candidatus Hydrogenedentes bacterium]|nr:MATE family efflux transporter [Candidatus Hydrogenedentota bacterium]
MTTADHVDDIEPRWAGLKEVLRMAGPVILSNMSFTVMQFVDMAFVSRLGTAQLAAVGSAALWSWVVASLFVGLVSSVSTFVSQSLGRGEKENCTRYAWQSIYISLATSLIGFAIYPLTGILFGAMGHPADVTRYEIEYFEVRVLLYFLIPWQAALSAFFMGINRPMVPMLVTVISNLTNIVLDYGLIFGKFGLPRMEVAGAAWATVAALAVQSVVLQAIFMGGATRTEFGSMHRIGVEWRKVKELVRIGMPAGFMWMLDVITWGVFTSFLVGRFGEVALAAHNAAIQVMHISFMPAIGLNHAIAPIVGQWIGRGNVERAKSRAYLTTRIAIVYMFVMGAIFAVLGKPILVAAFGASTEVASLGHTLLLMAAVFQGFDAVTIVLSGALRGAGDTKWQAIVMGIAAYFVFLPLAFALAILAKGGAIGAWIGATTYIIGLSGLFFYRFYGEKWREINIFSEPVSAVEPEAGADGTGRKSGATPDTCQ